MSVPGWLLASLFGAGALYFAARASSPCRRGRLRGQWLRWTRWEYWPPWALYGPILIPLLWRSRRYGGLRSATCVNPGIALGGLVGESKADILALLGDRPEVARWVLVDPGPLEDRRAIADRFASSLDEGVPVVLKPDRGERGAGVRITRSAAEREAALREISIPVIAQEYVEGIEFGVFWYRPRGSARGEVFSVTRKEMVKVTGDGMRTLEELMLREDRLLPLLDLHREKFAARLGNVPGPAEEVCITELGTHALGATFRDAGELRTAELAGALDEIMETSGLDFGRFDVRVSGAADLAAGRNFKVLEFNGLSSEATHIYDPDGQYVDALATLLDQWSIAMRLGQTNREAGREPARWIDVWKAVRAHSADRADRGA